MLQMLNWSRALGIVVLLPFLVLSVSTGSVVHARGPLAHREPDPVIIPGAVLGAPALGRSIDSLRLYARARSGGLLVPIPLQVDERDPDGAFVLSGGQAAGRDVDGGRLDDNDELVFLARDAGLRSSERPPDADSMTEIRVTDPQTGRRGWVYLAAFPPQSRPVPSPVRYMEFDPARDWITTRAYHLRFTDPSRPFTVTWTSTPEPGGEPGTDFLDTVKVRLSGKLFGFNKVTKTDMDFESTDRGYIAGPIRIVRVMETRLRLIGRLRAPGAKVCRIYYPDWVEAPVPISLPFKITVFFSEPDVFFGNDFDLPRDRSHRYYSDRFPSGIPIGGPVDVAASPAVSDDDVAWQGVAGPLGALITAVRLPDSMPMQVKTVFDITDRSDEPEEVRGATPLVGRRLVGWENVSRGSHLAYFYDFYPLAYRPGDEQKFMWMLSDPVLVDVTPTHPQTTALPESAASVVPTIH